jgi:hypothetical protein
MDYFLGMIAFKEIIGDFSHLLPQLRTLNHLHTRQREVPGAIFDQQLLPMCNFQAFAAFFRGDHGAMMGEGLYDFDSRAAAEANRDNRCDRLKIVWCTRWDVKDKFKAAGVSQMIGCSQLAFGDRGPPYNANKYVRDIVCQIRQDGIIEEN